MIKKKNKEKEFLEKSSKVIKFLCLLIGIILTLIYCIDGGFYSLLFDLRESKTIIIYSIVIIVLLCLLVVLNISDQDVNSVDKKWINSSYVTVGIIVLIILFGLLFVFTLIDFFLPIIVLIVFLVITYHLVDKLIKILVNKYGLK